MARIFCSSVNMFHLLRVQEIVRIPPKRSKIVALTRASLACDGRSLPLMSCVVPLSQTVNAEVHERFFESLAECFTPETNVIVITDAGFQGRWFQQVSSPWLDLYLSGTG